MSTSGRVYDDFVRLLFLYEHREARILAGELPEESEKFRFLRATRLANLKGSVGLLQQIKRKLGGEEVEGVGVGLIFRQSLHNEGYYSHDLSTRPLKPLPRFFHSRRAPPERHMVCVHFESFIGLLCIIVLA